MLTHPTLDLLHQLGLNGMAKAFAETEASAEATTLTHPEWLALLLDQEVIYVGNFLGLRGSMSCAAQ